MPGQRIGFFYSFFFVFFGAPIKCNSIYLTWASVAAAAAAAAACRVTFFGLVQESVAEATTTRTIATTICHNKVIVLVNKYV